MKRIVVLCDGTWNSPEKSYPAKDKPTNVISLKRIINTTSTSGVVQIVNYIRGIGTYSAGENLVGGLGGYGIERHIRQAYEFISDNYEKNDQIFLFGFSRGAYTVRSLAGLLHEWGIIPKHEMYRFPLIYGYYKKDRQTQSPEERLEYEELFCDIHGMTRTEYQEFERNRASTIARLRNVGEPVFIDTKSIPVWFLGVWDTVGTIGYPDPIFDIIYQSERDYHIVELTPNISNACHALAIHELRAKFPPVLWTNYYSHQLVAQVWFPGSHSDVGGGQVVDTLSNLSLKWMLTRAEEVGLEFNSKGSSKIVGDPLANIDVTIASLEWALLGSYLREEIGDPTKGVFQCVHDSVSRRSSAVLSPDYPPLYRHKLREADNLSLSGKHLLEVDDKTTLVDIVRRHQSASGPAGPKGKLP